MADSGAEVSTFQKKYMEFVEDLRLAFPEYSTTLDTVASLDDATKMTRFQQEVKATVDQEDDPLRYQQNPGCVLPGLVIDDSLWSQLSENTQKAIWEHIQILSVCCFLESGFNDSTPPPAWMDDAMNEMKKKLESSDFQDMFGKFMKFFKPTDSDEKSASASDSASDGKEESSGFPFGAGFPKIPEKFMKGHIARLAQEIVKEITPADLGLTDEMISECEKDPSRAFNILFSTFSNNPTIIQRTISKIGNRLKQKVVSGSIKPQEIAKEAEELMKEFMDNKPFVEMMNGFKSAFGFEDMDDARKAGKEHNARLSIVKERLRRKLEKKNQSGKK
jgi:hypothetical protein